MTSPSRATLNSFKSSRLLAILAVLAYYLWASTVFNDFGTNGYYNYLTRGFFGGHLYVPIEVDPRLLAQPNPYDPAIPDEIRVTDMAMYKGRYFVYHGPAPVLLTFGPYRLLTHRDLPEAMAVFFFACVGFLANSLTLAKLRPQAGWLAFVALGLANCIPFLLHRVFVYEVAISCGYACLAVGLALYFRQRYVSAGLFFGLALLSRPHLGLALLFVSPRCWLTASIGLTVSLIYNYLRFGSPFEIGLSYLLAGPGQQTPHYSISNLLPSLYLFWLQPPEWTGVPPFLRIVSTASIQLPAGFFHENMIGGLWLAPFLIRFRMHLRLALLGGAVMLFLCSTGWVTLRYTVDFLPWLVLAALARMQEGRLEKALLAIGIAINLVLHWLGPYNAA